MSRAASRSRRHMADQGPCTTSRLSPSASVTLLVTSNRWASSNVSVYISETRSSHRSPSMLPMVTEYDEMHGDRPHIGTTERIAACADGHLSAAGVPTLAA